MTHEQTRRVIEAIAECDRIIDREMKYLEANRNKGLIDETTAHKAKLEIMLNLPET